MGFIKYEKERKEGKILTEVIGINTNGRFVFYKPVYRKYFNNKAYVELYYDSERNSIGILPISEPTENSIKLLGRTTKMIVAKKFLSRFKINLKNDRYECIEDGKMIVIPLKEVS